MSIIAAVPSATKQKSTGTHKLSVVTANVADGDTVTLDGDVALDEDGNVAAWANVAGGSDAANVDTAANADEVTINHNAGAATDVTVTAIVE